MSLTVYQLTSALNRPSTQVGHWMPKPAIPARPDAGYHDLLDELEGVLLSEGERTVGVIGRAYADALLEKLLHAYLLKGKITQSLLHHSGVLGSFGARIDLCYALGLLPKETHSDLHLVREIGNYCAHHIDISSFDSAPLKDWCRCFYVAKQPSFFFEDPTRSAPRVLYTVALLVIAQEIDAVHSTVVQKTAPPLQLPKLGIRRRI